MNELLTLLFLLILVLVSVVVFSFRRFSNFKRKTAASVRAHESHSEKFREGFFSTLSEVVFANELGKSISSVAAGISRAFDADTFIFERIDEHAGLVGVSAKNPEKIANLLIKAGLKLDVHKIPLSEERKKIFDSSFSEFADPFPLIGDMTTSAACRKIQRDLEFNSLVSASAKTDSGDYVILVLLPERFQDAKRDLNQFALLLRSAFYLSNLKIRLREFEHRFDEQFIYAKNELREKESAHLSLFNEMTIAAAALDERGVITEANEALKRLFGDSINAVGQPFSAIIDERGRRDFIEFLMNLSPENNSEINVEISGRSFRAYMVSQKSREGQRVGFAVYLVDETTGVNLQRELGRTIDTLRAENQLADKLALEERKHSEEIVRNAAVPMLAVAGGNIEFASESARQLFILYDGELLEEFIAKNRMSTFSTSESTFETNDSRGRTFSVNRWNTSKYFFFSFREITELKSAEVELHRLSIESERLFGSLLPTALVKENRFAEWNDMFESLFKDFLSSDGSFDGFLRYLGESPEACESELRSNAILMRMCRTTDRKFLNFSAAVAEGSIFVFIEDMTEQENVKQRLRGTQNLLASSLESFSDEPIFVVENGVISASNLAARNKLDIRLDETFTADDFLARIGAAQNDDTVELSGKFYRIEMAALGGSSVYHFREIGGEIAQRSEINRLKRRQEILRDLAAAERYENVLQNLYEILKNDGVDVAKVVGIGTIQTAKEIAEIYLLTVSTEKVEPSLSLSLTPEDISLVERGGVFSKTEVPDTTFINVVSAGDSKLLLASTTIGDVCGFASVALQDGNISEQNTEELINVLKTVSSVAVGISTRLSVERKFEDSGKVTRALVGLTGIGEGSFEEVSRKTIDLLRQVFSSDSVGIYSAEGAALTALAVNGNLPNVVSIPSLKFGVLMPAVQLEGSQMKTAEGFYFAVKSRPQKLALIFRFVGIPPAPSELSAIASIALDLLESKRGAENQSKVAARLVDESKLMNEFMTGLAESATSQEVLKVLEDSLLRKSKEATVTVGTDEGVNGFAKPLEIVEKEDGEFTTYEANLLNFGVGIITVRCSRDGLSRTMVELSIDKIRSLLALKLPAVQNEASGLRLQLERTKNDYSNLRESVDKIPASLRNARIEIDGALSRLSFVQGDDSVMQEIKLHLASAAKEISIDLDNSSRNQDEIFEAVRVSIMQQEASAPRIRNFDISVLTEFRVDPATFDLIKDLFANFVITSQVPECEVLMMTAQPSPNEAAEGKGKHINIRLTANEGEILHEDVIKDSGSIQTLADKLEKMGYRVDTRALGNELTMDICEVKPGEAAVDGASSAILVEDDRMLAEEESRNLLAIFSRLKVASDAVDATKIFEAEKFNAALVDLSLPSINGRELCQQIKKLQPDCVTILLVNREGEEKSEGVDYIMLRPLDENTIRNYIRK